MRNVKQMKADHALRCSITSEDEYYYKEPAPLTEDQKLQLLQIEEDIKRKFGEMDLVDVLWREKRFADTCDKDERLW